MCQSWVFALSFCLPDPVPHYKGPKSFSYAIFIGCAIGPAANTSILNNCDRGDHDSSHGNGGASMALHRLGTCLDSDIRQIAY